MMSANQYPGLVYIADGLEVDEKKFNTIAPAIAQALHWAFFERPIKSQDSVNRSEIDMFECIDTIFSYGAQEGLTGPQLDAIYTYANPESNSGLKEN